MTEEKLVERLQQLWVRATAGCGAATPQIIEEIREVEKLLEAVKTDKPERDGTPFTS